MDERIATRIEDIIDAIDQIDLLLAGKSIDDLQEERVTRAAYERFLEIMSEASRYIRSAMQERAPQIPWKSIRDIGNRLRHAYQDLDRDLLWDIHANGAIAELRQAVDLMLKQG